MMLRVAKIPSLNVAAAAIDAVTEELRGGDKTKESIDDGVLRIKGRHGREYLFLLSDLFMDDLVIQGDSSKTNWTGKCPMSIMISNLRLICVTFILNH